MLRVNVWDGYMAFEDVQAYGDRGPRANALVFRTRLQVHFEGAYGSFWLPDHALVELHDMIEKYLELPKPEPVVKVVVEQPRPRRVKRRPSPAQELEDRSEVALTPEERAIHRRMLEGR
jgi:hypothetical protein